MLSDMHQDKVYVYLYACASICNLCFAGKRKSDQGHHVTVYLPVSECNKGFQAVHVHVGLPESRNYHLLFFFSSLYRVLYVYNCKKSGVVFKSRSQYGNHSIDGRQLHPELHTNSYKSRLTQAKPHNPAGHRPASPKSQGALRPRLP